MSAQKSSSLSATLNAASRILDGGHVNFVLFGNSFRGNSKFRNLVDGTGEKADSTQVFSHADASDDNARAHDDAHDDVHDDAHDDAHNHAHNDAHDDAHGDAKADSRTGASLINSAAAAANEIAGSLLIQPPPAASDVRLEAELKQRVEQKMRDKHDRIQRERRRLLAERQENFSCYANQDVQDEHQRQHDLQDHPDMSTMSTSGWQVGHVSSSSRKPIHIYNVRDLALANQKTFAELTGPSSYCRELTRTKIQSEEVDILNMAIANFGDIVASDLSHTAIDFRHLVKQAATTPEAGKRVLLRWCLRRIFRADWTRDCFLCDRPLAQSCYICFCSLHTEQQKKMAKSVNAVVCSVILTNCKHLFHYHCWRLWKISINHRCPKCDCNAVEHNREVFVLEKMCPRVLQKLFH